MALIYTPGNSWRRMVDTVIHGTWAVVGRAWCLLERTGGPATTRLYHRHVLVLLLYHTYSIVSSWYVSVLQFQSILSYGDSRSIERYEKEISNAIKASKTVFHDGAFKLIQVYLFRSSGQNLSIETTGLLNYRAKMFFKTGFENSADHPSLAGFSQSIWFFHTKRVVIYSIFQLCKWWKTTRQKCWTQTACNIRRRYFTKILQDITRSPLAGFSESIWFCQSKRIVIYSIVSVVKLVEGNKTKLLNRDCI